MSPDPEQYARLLATAKIRERPLLHVPPSFSELELQARWFAGDFGRSFVGTAGEQIEIIQFGVWNRETGPDFSNAAVRINRRVVRRGSIEFDLLDQNWERHGHATNPAFDDTALHVFVVASHGEFFSRTSTNRLVPQVQVDPVKLPTASASRVPLARPGRCHAPLRGQSEEKITSILEAAARFRLQRKEHRLQRLTELHGAEEALYQELATALGYKENKLPFTLLAQRLSGKSLRGRPNEIESVLFGTAGFLGVPDLARFGSGTRQYLRTLWDQWWPRRADFERVILPPATWRLTGTRPLNHPQRRLAALARIVNGWPKLMRSLGKDDLNSTRDFFRELAHPYWNFHYTLASEPSTTEMALVGEARVTEILANVVLPWRGLMDRAVWSEFVGLPARLTNRRIETGAARLFGDDPRRPRFLRSVAGQQGVLQIYEDFCLHDESDCAQCPFPEQMQKWI